MLVLVTGGTGYVGAHAVAALAGAGHRIRVLARSAEKIPAALGPLGVDGVETAIGDVTEPAAVERALAGCDAVGVLLGHPQGWRNERGECPGH